MTSTAESLPGVGPDPLVGPFLGNQPMLAAEFFSDVDTHGLVWQSVLPETEGWAILPAAIPTPMCCSYEQNYFEIDLAHEPFHAPLIIPSLVHWRSLTEFGQDGLVVKPAARRDFIEVLADDARDVCEMHAGYDLGTLAAPTVWIYAHWFVTPRVPPGFIRLDCDYESHLIENEPGFFG